MSAARPAVRVDFTALHHHWAARPKRFDAMTICWEGSPLHLLQPRSPEELAALLGFLDITSKVGVESGWFHLEQLTIIGAPGISDRFGDQVDAMIGQLERTGIYDPKDISVTLRGDVAYEEAPHEDDDDL